MDAERSVNGDPQIAVAASMVQRLSLATSVADIMTTVTDMTRRLLHADGVTFVLRDGDQCFYAEEDCIAPLWKGRRFPMSACISGWVMLHKTPAVVEDITTEPRIPQDAYEPTFIKSMAMVPVRASQPVGAIGAYWGTRHHATDSETGMLQAVADASSLAIAHLELNQAKQKLEQQNLAKYTYLASASHDLRQPVQSLFLFLQALSSSPLDEQARAVLARMELALTGMKEMMESILDMSRVEAGVCKPRIDAVPLSLVFEPIASAYEPLAQKKGITWRWTCPDVFVRTDLLLLIRMVRNIVENAVKYTQEGYVSLTASVGDGAVSIIVEDTGIGIPSEHLDDIFGAFTRLADTRQRGYGLGLATVRRLSDLLGHPVRVSSEPGRGSAFEITVPIA